MVERRIPAETHSPALTLGFVLLITAVRLLVLGRQQWPLYGDEAQYWLWAEKLDWGYYSKPPLIAWVIAATTRALGDTEFAVRLASPLFHAGTAVLVGALGRRLYGERVGFWSALAYATLPAVSLSALLISTDVPLLFFQALGLWALARALAEDRPRDWLLVGIALGLGLLSKYAMAWFVPSAALYFALAEPARLKDRRVLGALALGVLIYSPNLVWNGLNGFASYRHTGANANLGGSWFHPEAFAEFVGAQFAVMGPLLFAGLIALLARPRALIGDRNQWFLAAFAIPQLIVIAALAFLSRANANWAASCYVSATVLVVAAADRAPWRRRVIIGSVALHSAVAVLAYTLHDLAPAFGVPLTAKTDPYRRLRGPRELAHAIEPLLAGRPGAYLMTDERLLFDDLSFYLRPRPPMIDWYDLPDPHNQAEVTNDIRLVNPSGDGIVFVTRRSNPAALARFKTHELLSVITIPLYPDLTLRYDVYAIGGFTG